MLWNTNGGRGRVQGLNSTLLVGHSMRSSLTKIIRNTRISHPEHGNSWRFARHMGTATKRGLLAHQRTNSMRLNRTNGIPKTVSSLHTRTFATLFVQENEYVNDRIGVGTPSRSDHRKVLQYPLPSITRSRMKQWRCY